MDEGRFVRMEKDVEFTRLQIEEMKNELRQFHSETKLFIKDLREDMKSNLVSRAEHQQRTSEIENKLHNVEQEIILIKKRESKEDNRRFLIFKELLPYMLGIIMLGLGLTGGYFFL